MTPNEIAAGNVRRFRRARGWSQAELAGHWGVTRRVVVNAEERGVRRKPRVLGINDVVALAAAFGVSVTDLISPPPPCATCEDAPPEGFTCQACGADGFAGVLERLRILDGR